MIIIFSVAVAFYAWITNTHLYVRNGYTVRFDNTSLNLGGGYNPISGVFTAPHPGTYGFSWTISVYGEGWMSTSLMKNNVVKDTILADNTLVGEANIDALTTTGLAIVQLNMGDRVYIKVRHVYNNVNIYSLNDEVFSTFSGWMVN